MSYPSSNRMKELCHNYFVSAGVWLTGGRRLECGRATQLHTTRPAPKKKQTPKWLVLEYNVVQLYTIILYHYISLYQHDQVYIQLIPITCSEATDASSTAQVPTADI